jgi:hypothetical protein
LLKPVKVKRNIKKKDIRPQEQFTSKKKKKILNKKRLNEVFVQTKETNEKEDDFEAIKEIKVLDLDKLPKHKKRQKLKVTITSTF